VFAQSAGGRFDMGALMKQAMAALDGRGGGARDFAQGGAPAEADVQAALDAAEKVVRSQESAAVPGVAANALTPES
jgi:alanyl-tRNA synthetase